MKHVIWTVAYKYVYVLICSKGEGYYTGIILMIKMIIIIASKMQV